MPPTHHTTTSPPAARHYHPTLSIWLSVDPMADKYPGVSPYTYCGNNPVRLVDPDGREINPVFDWYGDFLGYDDAGEGGLPIVMEGSHFSPGMSHQQAIDNMKHDLNRGLGLTEEGKSKIINFYLEHSASPGSASTAASFWDNISDVLNRVDIACRGHADNSRWEGHGDYWDRKFAEAVEPFAMGAATIHPMVGFYNAFKIVTTREDIYGVSASKTDIGMSWISIGLTASESAIPELGLFNLIYNGLSGSYTGYNYHAKKQKN